jgi:Fe-S-cluster containining protein
MENDKSIKCIRCGACCHVDMLAYVSNKDIERWEKEQRFDIIGRIQNKNVIWFGDRIIDNYGEKITSCIYLNRDLSSFFCEIYNTRPLVCRNFTPGSSELCPQYKNKAKI